jgi:hypothetical protein
MRWQLTEFIFKGMYLGMLLFVGLVLNEATWGRDLAQVGVFTFGTLSLFLAVAAWRTVREGYKVQGRWGPFILFLLLENPGMVFAGVLLGMLLGAGSLMSSDWSLLGQTVPRNPEEEQYRLLYCIAGGAVLGAVFNSLYQMELKVRRLAGLIVGGLLIAGTIYYLPKVMPHPEARMAFACLLLLGIPLFYVLTLSSMTEETEVEIMAICAALGVSIWILAEHWWPDNSNIQITLLLVPPTIYYLYTRRVLPGLRVFKHVLRGISYANVGKIRPALISLGRALQLDPNNSLAREQLWKVHRLMDFDQVVKDKETLALLNFDLCLDRVATLLLADKVKPEWLTESHRLLGLVSSQRPDMQPRVDYWRAVALTHERHFEDAAASLERVITGEGTERGNPHRRSVLYKAWQLALMLHPELNRRVGTPQLAVPGRRMQAITATERRLAQAPEDNDAKALKQYIYSELTETEFQTHVVEGKPPETFDYPYVQQLGLALVNDPQRWQVGCEYLRIAANGLPAQGPTICLTIAQAHEKAGNFGEVWYYYELGKRMGRAAGPDNLGAEDKQTYYAMLKALGEDAAKRGDNEAAIENFRLFASYERAGANIYRTLAELYERKGEVWNALYSVEHGLVHDKADKELLERKDRYYYSIQADEVKANWEKVQRWFDLEYCKNKARWALDHMGEDLELLDWASHLAELAQVAEPHNLATRVLRARIARRRGDNDTSIALLEEVRAAKAEKFPTNDEEDAWYLANRLLGDLYLNVKPDQALLCLQEYRKHGKSGADTLYKMGIAYEHLGDAARAAKCYETVAAYESHPLAPDARAALSRLKSPQQV